METFGRQRQVLFCLYSHNVWGGIELWLTGLARFLRGKGWSVHVGLARGLRFNDPDAFRNTYPDLPTVEFDGRTGTSEGRIRAVERALKALRPDVVIPVGLAEVFSAAVRVKETGQPLRVLAPLRATSPDLMGDMATYAPAIDLCVGNNPLHARFLENRGVFPHERMRTIINGVSLPSIERLPHNGVRADARLLFVGRLHPHHKRILDLPALVEELERRRQPFELTVVGDGEGRERLLHSLGRQLESGTVQFLGHVSPERIASEIYPAHEMLIHLSGALGEGCPQVLQQALAQGVVPICSEFLGLHSLGFLRDGETCCIFPVGDVVRAADHVERLHRQPELLWPLARAGQHAMREFEMGRVLNTWAGAIDDVCRLPQRECGPGLRQLAAIVPGSSRLERLGTPPAAADWLRRVLRRFPELADGWAEWPGTLAILDDKTRSAMMAELKSLDEQARLMRSGAIVTS